MLINNSRKIASAFFMISMISLTGCQNYIKRSALVDSPQSLQKNYFSIQGKIGVKTQQQSGSAFFEWQQQGDSFRIDLTGVLGLGKTHIEGDKHQVSLTSARTGTIYSDSPEDLLEQATGWQAPITHLISWVQGQPATQKAIIEYDQSQRITKLKEDGWLINLSYTGTQTTPTKLLLQQPVANNQENRITMIIQNS